MLDQAPQPVDVQADDEKFGGVADMLLIGAERRQAVAQRNVGDAHEGVHMPLRVGWRVSPRFDDQVQVAGRQWLAQKITHRPMFSEHGQLRRKRYKS